MLFEGLGGGSGGEEAARVYNGMGSTRGVFIT